MTEYERGFADGVASRESDVAAIERVADFWYFRAVNPRAEWPEVRIVDSIIRGREANEDRAREYERLDAIEQERFGRARKLLAEGADDLTVATQVGLFLPIVANLREGVL